jgi:hypothetical protein
MLSSMNYIYYFIAIEHFETIDRKFIFYEGNKTEN